MRDILLITTTELFWYNDIAILRFDAPLDKGDSADIGMRRDESLEH